MVTLSNVVNILACFESRNTCKSTCCTPNEQIKSCYQSSLVRVNSEHYYLSLHKVSQCECAKKKKLEVGFISDSIKIATPARIKTNGIQINVFIIRSTT